MLDDLKVGDEIGFYRRDYLSGDVLSHGFSRIAKINHHGHIILEDGQQFNRHGEERKAEDDGMHLITIECLRDLLESYEMQMACRQAANELKRLIDAQKTGQGEYRRAVDDKARERMIALVNKL